jgi:hypothetical protein
MIPCLDNFKYYRHLYEKVSSLFKKDSIVSLLSIYEKEFTNNNLSKNHNYLYNLLYSILEKGCKNMVMINSNNNNKTLYINNTSSGNNSNPNAELLNYNNYLFRLFQNIIESIFSLNNTTPQLITNQIHVLLAKTFQKLIKLIYRFYKPYSLYSKDRLNVDKLYDDIYNGFLFHIIKNDEIGNHIKLEYINVIPYLILYGKNRQSYYNFVEDEIFKSKQFFTKRCSINFIEKCLSLFSFKLFTKFNFGFNIQYWL